LEFDSFLKVTDLNPNSKKHNEYKRTFKLLGRYDREIPEYGKVPTEVHSSVKNRYDDSTYKSTPIENYLKLNAGKWPPIVE
jgi:hypothetical protein